jgi:hypothetical protein
MTQAQAAAYVMAQAACAYARIASMQCQNQADLAAGRHTTFNGADFDSIPNEYGIHHNAVLTLLHSAQP